MSEWRLWSIPELSELDSCFFAAGLGTPGLAAGDFTGAGFAVQVKMRLDINNKHQEVKVGGKKKKKKGTHLPATFLSSSLLSSLLSEESLSLALLAAGAAGALWIEAGGGTALYAPRKTNVDRQHQKQIQTYFNK